jgi:CheY-like chemotaxis protein
MKVPDRSVIILMADDDEDDCLLVRDALGEVDLNVEIRFVGDGRELMEYLHQCKRLGDDSAPSCPDLILLDLNMPRKDGREALKEIKSHPEFKGIPVVILTTSSEDRDIELCYKAGANSYLVKPFLYEEMVDAMKSLCKYWFNAVTLPSDGSQQRDVPG